MVLYKTSGEGAWKVDQLMEKSSSMWRHIPNEISKAMDLQQATINIKHIFSRVIRKLLKLLVLDSWYIYYDIHSLRTKLNADRIGITCQITVTRLWNSERNLDMNGVLNWPHFRSRSIVDLFDFGVNDCDHVRCDAHSILPGASDRSC